MPKVETKGYVRKRQGSVAEIPLSFNLNSNFFKKNLIVGISDAEDSSNSDAFSKFIMKSQSNNDSN